MRAIANKAEIPIQLMFYIFPLISLAVRLAGGGEVNYDPIWIGGLALLIIGCCVRGRFTFKERHVKFLTIVIVLFVLKYILPWIYTDHLSAKASLMDGKWMAYLMFSILWIGTFGYPSIEKMYKAGVFFSVIYILKTLFVIATAHELTRAGVLLEANYDGFMILIVYCFSSEVKNKKKWEDWILIAATFMTLSRTGFASIFALWVIRAARKNILWLLLLIPFVAAVGVIGFMMRGAESAGHLDRFVYWQQAFLAFDGQSFWDCLFGNTPGQALKMSVMSEFVWTIDLFEDMRNLRGIYPFMFHSTYLRLAFTWGIPVAILFAVYFVRKFLKSKYLPLKYLCVLVLIQSFSLSSLTLPNVSVLLFMAYIVGLKKEHDVARKRRSKIIRLKRYDTSHNPLLLAERRPYA